MAVPELNGAPSRRYVRAYLAMWAVAGVVALGYLATLAWQPEQLAPAPARPKVVEIDPGLKAATKALAEVGTVRQTVDNLQKEIGDLKETIEQRGDHDKTLQLRLAALEEKVAALPGTVTVSGGTTTPAVKPKVAEKAQPEKAPPEKAAKAAPAKAAQQKPGSARIITVTEDKPGTAPSNTAKQRIETGSIKQAEVVFGEAVVTRAGDAYAVQLDVAPSLDVLRMRWGLLVERYGATLATLQPRYVAPRTPGAPYRLLAGPLTSAADAKGICAELRQHLPACSTTDFAGDPL